MNDIIETGHFLIPECCREGWETCPHVVKPQKVEKKNIAL